VSGCADLPDRVVLVGFMAAGKSTVGSRLADRIGYAFADLDDEVERAAGRTIPEIFRTEGETAFRELEARVTARFDDRRRLVLAAGGGWMARPELRDRWPDAVRIWLRVSPEEVLRRLAGRLDTRPVLDPGSPERSIRAILERRRPAYAEAELAVETDGLAPGEVVERVLEALEERGASGEAAGHRKPNAG